MGLSGLCIFSYLKQHQIFLIILLLTVFALINVYLRFPGEMGTDAISQYRQIHSGVLTDWHPPIMALLWSLLDRVWRGSGLLFVLHAGLYWLGYLLLAVGLYRCEDTVGAWCVVAIALFPTNVLLLHEITKDVGLAVTCLIAFSVIYSSRRANRSLSPIVIVSLIVLIIYATLVRANAIFATPALILYLIWPTLNRRPMVAIMFYIGMLIIFIPASGFINHNLIAAKRDEAIRSLEVFDMAGIADRTDDASMFQSQGNALEAVKRCYTPTLWDPIGGAPCGLLPRIGSPTATLWLRAIQNHPRAYLRHRLSYFSRAINSRYLHHIPEDEAYDWNYFLNSKPHLLKDRILNTVFDLSVFTPLFSALLGLITLVLLTDRKIRATAEGTLALFLMLSGQIYLAAYFIVGVASEFRYFLWCMVSLPLALLFAFRAVARASKSERSFLIIWPTVGIAITLAITLELTLPKNFAGGSLSRLSDRRTGLLIHSAPWHTLPLVPVP